MCWLAFVLPCVQGVSTDPERPETLRITISGEIGFAFVHRDRNLTRAGAAPEDFGSSLSEFEGAVLLRLDLEVTAKVRGVLALGTPYAVGGEGGFVEPFGGNERLGSMGFFRVGDSRDLSRFGANPEELAVLVDEASVRLDVEDLSLIAGIGPAAFDIRGKGSAFFFDPRHSSTFAKNAGPGGSGTFLGLSDELQPAGLRAVWSKDDLSIGLFLLPAMIEGGSFSDDEAAYALWAMLALGGGSRVGAIAALNRFPGGNTAVATLGGGGAIHFEGVEVYAEAYFQFGDSGRGPAGDLESRAWAMQAGVEYRAEKFWAGVNFKYLSGDDDVLDDRVSTFLSYESIDDTMILEDQYTGLDLDTNYWTIQASGGLSFRIGSVDAELSGLFALCFLAKDVLAFDGSGTNAIGHEADLRFRIRPARQLSFETGFAFLFASDVLRDVAAGGEDGFGRTAYLWTVGTTLTY